MNGNSACVRCGAQLGPGQQFCTACGQRVTVAGANNTLLIVAIGGVLAAFLLGVVLMGAWMVLRPKTPPAVAGTTATAAPAAAAPTAAAPTVAATPAVTAATAAPAPTTKPVDPPKPPPTPEAKPPEAKPAAEPEPPPKPKMRRFEAGQTIVYKDREHERMNLRAGPSRSADILTKIPWGADMEVVAQDGEWVKVRFEGRSGWCLMRSPKDPDYYYLHPAGD